MIEVYEEIVRYVDEHIDEEITISDLLKATGYSRRHLYRLFKKHNNTPLMEYIRRKKLTSAADKVRSSKKMYEIALDYGYETPAGFYKAFLSIYGCSPSDYKNNMLRSVIVDNVRSAEKLTKLIDLEPDNAALYVERSKSYQRESQYDKSIEDCKKAIVLGSKDEVYRILGWSYSALNELEKAIEAYTEATELFPDSAEYYRFRANIHNRLRQPEKAMADFNKAIELEPNSSHTYNNRGILYSQQNKLDKAIEDYTKAIELDPDRAYLYTNRAGCYNRLNQHDKAEADYNKALELDSGATDAWSCVHRGNSYMQLKQYDKALENYDKALELNPKFDWVYLSRAYLHSELKQYDKAASDYEKAIECNPDHICPYESLGFVYEKLGEYDKAGEIFIKATEGDPDNAWNYQHIVSLCTYRYKGQQEKIMKYCTIAMEYFNRALGIYTEELGRRMRMRDERDWQTRIYRWRAACYEAMGMHEKAEADFDKAIELEADKIYVYRFRISRYLQSQQYDKAAETAKKALEKDPDAPPSAVTCAYNYLVEKQHEKAIKELREALELNPDYIAAAELLEAITD